MLHASRTLLFALCLHTAAVAAVAGGPTATRGPVKNADGKVLDEQGVILENAYLRAAITTNKYAGQVMELTYKPTGQELGAMTPQGYCMDRSGEERGMFARSGRDYAGRIVEEADAHAVAETVYTWDYDYGEKKTEFRVRKTFTLRKGAALLEVTWAFQNVGEQEVFFTPWVKHLGGHDDTLLAGPTLMLGQQGPYDPGGAFVKPVTDWVARLSGKETTEKLPMVTSVMDYAQIFQQFPWRGKHRFTLETVLNRVTVAPGKTWSITYVLGVTPNLSRPLYVAPELAAELDVAGEPKAKTPCKVTARIAPALALGAKRLEGEVLTLDGRSVAKLPNREVTLTPGEFATAEYSFTPPADGVYNLSLTVYDEQKIFRLGQAVNSQQSSITLPLVVGPTPDVVVQKWQSGGFAWPRREKRTVKPFRTALTGGRYQVAQVRMPERTFPEDAFVFADKSVPARIRLAKGEYETLQFAVCFDKPEDAAGLLPEVTPIRHENGGELAEAVLREQVYLTTEVPSGYKSFPVGQWPDPLFNVGWEKRAPDGKLTKDNLKFHAEGRKRVYFLTVQAPREGASGVYKGEVVLKQNGEEAARFPIEVEVDAFAIPKRASFRCSTGWVGFKGAKGVKSNMQALGMAEEDIVPLAKDINDKTRKLLLAYGWTPTMWFGPKEQRKYYDYGRGVSMFACGGKSSKEHIDWLKEEGLLKYAFVYAPFDEHTNAEVPAVVEWAKKWKAEHEIPILDCYYGDRVKPLFGLVDIWLGQSPAQDWAKERKKKGDRFIACNQSLIWHVEYEPITGRADFWKDFMLGYDGRYVYSTVRWTMDIWKKNWTSGNYMGCVVYPGPTTGVTTSIRFETLRDGVEDYDYLALLRQAVDKGEGPGEALAEAKKILADWNIRKEVSKVDGLYAMRTRIADLLGALAGAEGR